MYVKHILFQHSKQNWTHFEGVSLTSSKQNWTIKMGRRNYMNVTDKFKDIQMKEIWCEILIVLCQSYSVN